MNILYIRWAQCEIEQNRYIYECTKVPISQGRLHYLLKIKKNKKITKNNKILPTYTLCMAIFSIKIANK